MSEIKDIKRIICFFLAMVFVILLLPISSMEAKAEDGSVIGMEIRTYTSTNLYTTSNGSDIAMVIPEDTRLIVRREENGRFEVDYASMQVWIGTGECIINIKDYIPSLEIYLDMARGSIFTMGGQRITGLTGEVLYNYPGAASGEEAWLRYGPAKKLAACQAELLESGYGLVIYDAYRPSSVTVYIRETFSAWLDGKSATFTKQFFRNLGQGWFLAPGVSSHNWGVAVDLTIRSMSTGEELPMPTDMHTLDYRSAYEYWSGKGTARAANGEMLRSVMTSHGFSSLKSEWWHFQDNVEPRIQMDVPN